MKNNRKAVEERQEQILRIVEERKEASVEELARLCSVSMMTVRRDLKLLDEQGRLHRQHGGASSTAALAGSMESQREIMLCRDSISRYAAQLIADGDVLFINGSRTALNALRYVKDIKAQVYTNNGWAVFESYPPGISVLLTGGALHQNVMIGEYVVQNLLSMTADKTLLGCAAVYDDGEFRYDIPTEISINEMMISRTRGELYILADHSKMLRRETRANGYGSFRYNVPVTLITDELADTQMLDTLRSHDIKVIQVPVRQAASPLPDEGWK